MAWSPKERGGVGAGAAMDQDVLHGPIVEHERHPTLYMHRFDYHMKPLATAAALADAWREGSPGPVPYLAHNKCRCCCRSHIYFYHVHLGACHHVTAQRPWSGNRVLYGMVGLFGTVLRAGGRTRCRHNRREQARAHATFIHVSWIDGSSTRA